MSAIAKVIRGIRDTLPPGYILGRGAGTAGPTQLISLKDLAGSLTGTGSILSPAQIAAAIAAISGRPSDFAIFWAGVTGATNIFVEVKFTRAITLPANLTGSYFTSDTVPAADYTVAISQNGTSKGTIVFHHDGTITVTFSSAVAFAAGDVFKLTGQVTADSTFANIGFAFKATFT